MKDLPSFRSQASFKKNSTRYLVYVVSWLALPVSLDDLQGCSDQAESLLIDSVVIGLGVKGALSLTVSVWFQIGVHQRERFCSGFCTVLHL